MFVDAFTGDSPQRLFFRPSLSRPTGVRARPVAASPRRLFISILRLDGLQSSAAPARSPAAGDRAVAVPDPFATRYAAQATAKLQRPVPWGGQVLDAVSAPASGTTAPCPALPSCSRAVVQKMVLFALLSPSGPQGLLQTTHAHGAIPARVSAFWFPRKPKARSLSAPSCTQVGGLAAHWPRVRMASTRGAAGQQ